MLKTLLLLSLAGCTKDSGITVHDDHPEVAILSPVDGTTFIAETPLQIEGSVSDDITSEDDLQLSWASSLEGSLDGEELRDGSAVSMLLERGLAVGEHVLSLQVTDGEGQTAEATRTISVVENQGPVITLLEPQPEDSFDEGASITVIADVSDDYDVNEALLYILSSSEQGQLEVTPEHSGELVSFALPEGLAEGVHDLELLAYDTLGASGAAVLSPVHVVANQPPVIELLNPAEDEVLRERDSLYVYASFSDDRDVSGALSLTWSGTALEHLTTESLPTSPDTNGVVEARLLLDGCDRHSSNDWEWLIEVEARDSEGAYTTATRRFFIGCQTP